MEFTATVTTTDDDPYASADARGTHQFQSDEPDWLPTGAGNDDHPAPVDYLVSSLAMCQASVLAQLLEDEGVETYDVTCVASIDDWAMRDDHPDALPRHTGALIEHLTVDVTLETTAAHREAADRCLALYDEGCIVGNSLAAGVEYTTETSLVTDQ